MGTLLKTLATKPSHAYLIVGTTAVQFAQEFVQYLFCPQKCGTCSHCTKLAHGTHPDLTWVSKAGKRISIDQVRELQQKALYPPVEAPKKIYVLESVEDLSLEAANSLLKILESPPKYLIFVLLAKSTNILPTILSRCQIVKLPTTPRSQIEKLLLERGLSDTEIEALLSLTKGLAPDESLIEAVREFVPQRPKLQKHLAQLPDQELCNALSAEDPFLRREAILELLGRLSTYTSAQVLALAAMLSKDNPDVIKFFIQEALYWYRDLLKEGQGQLNTRTVYALEIALWKLQRNANVQLLVESLLFTLRQELQEASA